MSIKCRLSTDRWSFAFRGAETYNGFPGNIKIIKNVNTSGFGNLKVPHHLMSGALIMLARVLVVTFS